MDAVLGFVAGVCVGYVVTIGYGAWRTVGEIEKMREVKRLAGQD